MGRLRCAAQAHFTWALDTQAAGLDAQACANSLGIVHGVVCGAGPGRQMGLQCGALQAACRALQVLAGRLDRQLPSWLWLPAQGDLLWDVRSCRHLAAVPMPCHTSLCCVQADSPPHESRRLALQLLAVLLGDEHRSSLLKGVRHWVLAQGPDLRCCMPAPKLLYQACMAASSPPWCHLEG